MSPTHNAMLFWDGGSMRVTARVGAEDGEIWCDASKEAMEMLAARSDLELALDSGERRSVEMREPSAGHALVHFTFEDPGPPPA